MRNKCFKCSNFQRRSGRQTITSSPIGFFGNRVFFKKNSVFKMHRGIIVCCILTWQIMFQSQFSGDGSLRFASFAESVDQLLYNPPASSKFATLKGWSSVQDGFPMFCLRPVEVCHCEHFMMFFANSNPKTLLLPHLRVITGPMPTELAAAHTCDRMRESFNNEHEHVAAFDSCANLEDKVATALCEDK